MAALLLTCLALLPLCGAGFSTGAADGGTDVPSMSCSGECTKGFSPVCGADGRTYGNECLAACQSVPLQHEGHCKGEDMLHAENSHVVQEAGSSVSLEHMRHFQAEGFTYTGQLKFTQLPISRLSAAIDRLPARAADRAAFDYTALSPRTTFSAVGAAASAAGDAVDAAAGGALGSDGSPMRVVRVTREGHVYVAEVEDSIQQAVQLLTKLQLNSTLPLLAKRTQRRPGSKWAVSSGGGGRPAHRGWEPSHDPPGQSQQQEQDHPQAGAAAATASSGSSSSSADGDATASGSTTSDSRGARPHTKQRAEGTQQQEEEEHSHQQARRNLGIFEADDRVDCPRTPTYPFTAVGQINVRDRAGNYVCSGTLVGPDVVLTAAHCVFSRLNQAFFDKLDFAPGRYRTPDGQITNPFGVVPWSYVTIYQGYSALATPDPNVWDVAVIKLSQKVGLTAGWMGIFEPCNAFSPTRYVANTAGYPSDQPPGSCKITQCIVSQEPCTDSYLYHKCDTASGQSGSPLWMLAMTASHKMGPYIRAVHNIEWVQSSASGVSTSYINSAVSITPDHYRSILAWIAPAFEDDPTAAARSPPMNPAPPPRQ